MTKYLRDPLALTYISKKDYQALLRESKQTVDTIANKYGAGWMFRMQGIVCALAVHSCALEAKSLGMRYRGAMGLYRLVAKYDYGSIFEDNHLEKIKPKDTTLSMMMFSMCQAETGDYGDDE